MVKNIQNILDECLDRINKGEDIEQCLQDYPGIDELRSLLLAASLTRKASATIQPRPEFKETAKTAFLAYVRAREYKQHKTQRHSYFNWHSRWVTAAIAALLVISMSGGMVNASSNSMPDDTFYPVKIAVENVRLSLASSDIAKAKLEAEYIDRRITEVAQMAETGQEAKTEAVANRLVQHLSEIEKISSEQDLVSATDENNIIALRDILSSYVTDHTLALEDTLQKAPSTTKGIVSQVLSTSQEHYTNSIRNINSKVKIKESSSDVSNEKEEIVNGVIRMTTDNNWVVGNGVIDIDSETSIEGSPVIGAHASAAVAVQQDGTVVGEKIVVQQQDTVKDTTSTDAHPSATPKKSSDQQEKKSKDDNSIVKTSNVNGIIGKISDKQWIVGSYSITINTDTVIEGDIEVGVPVRVTVLVHEDGTLSAQKVVIQNKDSDTKGEKNGKNTQNTPGRGR